MKIVRYEHRGTVGYGLWREGFIHPVAGRLFDSLSETGERLPEAEVRLLSPLRPNKLIAIGLNYREHAKEQGKPLPEEPLQVTGDPPLLAHALRHLVGNALKYGPSGGTVHIRGRLHEGQARLDHQVKPLIVRGLGDDFVEELVDRERGDLGFERPRELKEVGHDAFEAIRLFGGDVEERARVV